MELRKNGEFYEVSPWALLWEDENYYLIAFDSFYQEIRHYRVDKMLKISCIDSEREGKEYFEKFKTVLTKKQLFLLKGAEMKFNRDMMKHNNRLRHKKGDKK